MRQRFKLIASILVVLQLSSCASVQKKFTRKRKEPARYQQKVYMQAEGPYQKKFSNEYYYRTHFTMWRTWQGELLNQLGGNSKKVSRCAQEAESHLAEMRQYLKPERQAELDPILKDLTRWSRKIQDGMLARSEEGGARTDLERIRREVSNRFSYSSVEKDLLPDQVDLGV